jgi:osmotically-inducible protein OsmY
MKLATNAMVFGSALLFLSAVSTAAPADETSQTTTNAVEKVVISSKSGPSDQQVRAEVQAQINERPSLRFFNIVVYAFNREVYLKGLVDTMVDRDLAGAIADSVPGVKLVHNELAMNGS